MAKTAILVDGGFYKKRASHLWGEKTGEERAAELTSYCRDHIKDSDGKEERQLYRVLYYDCKPLKNMNVFHPFTKKNIALGDSDSYKWMTAFLDSLRRTRKFALRLGEMIPHAAHYTLSRDIVKKLFTGKVKLEDITENDFQFISRQKGVDMRIGLDIASLAYKRQVDQIILIAGDSDFVPAAKLARREGIDFILDPMWSDIREDLFENIDGLKSQWKKKIIEKS
jgi:uncharacterized LabA/DUF88 family protein